MTDQLRDGRLAYMLVSLAAMIVIVAGIAAAQSIIVHLMIALFLSVISYGIYSRLERWGVPSILAMILVILLILGLITSLIFLVKTTIDQFSSTLMQYQGRFSTWQADLKTWLHDLGIPFEDQMLDQYLNLTRGVQLFTSLLNTLGSTLSSASLVIAMVIFILMEAAQFTDKLRSAFRDPKPILDFIDRFNDAIERYFSIKTLINVASGLFIWIWTAIFGVQFALLWGMLTFLLSYIPYFGSVIAAVPPILIAGLTSGWVTAVMVALGFLVMGAALGNYIEPRIFGKGMGLSILVVFLSMLFWGWILGPIGMIFTVPLTVALKIGFESSPKTRWIALLLADRPPSTET